MPPKKKGGKKGKSADRDTTPGTATETASPDVLSELDKEFYLIQIRDLEARINRYQEKCDDLTIRNQEYTTKFETQSGDKQDIISFLKRTLEQKQCEVQNLSDKLDITQKEQLEERSVSGDKIAHLQKEYADMKDELSAEITILSGKLASLEEFRIQKEELLAKFAQLQQQLKQQESDHNETLYGLEKKAVIDNDKLKKVMVQEVNNVANEFRTVSNKQMADTIKRAIQENVTMNSQLGKMSDKTMELIRDNEELRAKDKHQKHLVAVLETSEKKLAEKNHSLAKVLSMMTEKSKKQEGLIEELRQKENDLTTLTTAAEELKETLTSTRSELEQLTTRERNLLEVVRELEGGREEERRCSSRLKGIMEAAARVVTEAVECQGTKQEECESFVQKKQVLQQLLTILNSAAAWQINPQTDGEDPIPRGVLSRAEQRLPSRAHYQLGNLGLVPREGETLRRHTRPASSCHKPPYRATSPSARANTTRARSSATPHTLSASTQTDSTPEAVTSNDDVCRYSNVTPASPTPSLEDALPEETPPPSPPVPHA
ncbi:PREDICTED: uncharacterized protein C9orf117 homolog isoform X2 [Priapulus caudatus]|uniref:Cilia- and flagella-associated protein 157 n=1 Tax=Priapulus caudatus TaxID=37621 RepID=A0ABM1EJZ9_PRICU|nr:PREDICTED: uncharacterized protein C9orf117 homolog isoform X2 [Priapulus caudatus]